MYTHKKQALDMIDNVTIVLSTAIFIFQIMMKFLKSKSAWRSTIELVIWSARMNCARVPNWSHSGKPRLFYGIRGHEKPGIYLLDAYFF